MQFVWQKRICCSCKNSKSSIESWSDIKKVHRLIQFNQEAWLKPCIEINTKLRTEAKNDFENFFFKLMNTSVFGKTMENARKHRDIKLVTTDEEEFNYCQNLITIQQNRVQKTY